MIELLNEQFVEVIKEIIKNKRDEESLKVDFPNPVLRQDVLSLLDNNCTVIYYPLEQEVNNGFHTDIPGLNGVLEHFVFINTAQTIEKQVFTAAHELGHAWNVDEEVSRICGLTFDGDLSERIINRFAAELLMPDDYFASLANRELNKHSLDNNNKTIEINEFLIVVANLMNYFYAPAKAIVFRFAELGIISCANAALVHKEIENDASILAQRLRDIIRENNWTQFLEPTNKKWIEGLPDLLDRAEKSTAVAHSKIKRIRELFELQPKTAPADDCEESVIQEINLEK